jgi:drug/metabolite transporter (DMT)-like permease
VPSPGASRRALLVLSYAVVCVVWGSTYLGIRFALDGFPPFLLGAIRFVVAGAVLLAVARARGEAAPTARQWSSAAITGALFFVVGNGLVNVAERSVSSGLASVLVATMPLWMTVFGRLLGDAASRREVAGVVLGLAGVVILHLGGNLRASPAGAAAGLLAPMGWALASLLSKRLPLPAGITRTGAQMLGGGAALVVVSLAMHEGAGTPTVRSVAAVVYLTLFGSLLGFTAYAYLLAHTRPAVATSYAYVNPVIAVLLGVIFAGEHFDAKSAVGAIVILAAVALVQGKRGPGPRAAAARAAPEPLRDTLAQWSPTSEPASARSTGSSAAEPSECPTAPPTPSTSIRSS